MLIELLSDYFLYGIYGALSSNFRTVIEQTCQIFSFIAFSFIVLRSEEDGDINHKMSVSKIYEIIVFIRVLKMVTLLYELKQMRVIIETIRNLIRPLS